MFQCTNKPSDKPIYSIYMPPSMHWGKRLMDVSLDLLIFLHCYWCYCVLHCFHTFHTHVIVKKWMKGCECGDTEWCECVDGSFAVLMESLLPQNWSKSNVDKVFVACHTRLSISPLYPCGYCSVKANAIKMIIMIIIMTFKVISAVCWVFPSNPNSTQYVKLF